MARARSPESALGGRSRLCQKPPEREAQMASGEMRDRPGVPHASRHLATASAAQLVERAAPAVSVSEPRPRKRCRRFVTAASCVKDGAHRTPWAWAGDWRGPRLPGPWAAGPLGSVCSAVRESLSRSTGFRPKSHTQFTAAESGAGRVPRAHAAPSRCRPGAPLVSPVIPHQTRALDRRRLARHRGHVVASWASRCS